MENEEDVLSSVEGGSDDEDYTLRLIQEMDEQEERESSDILSSDALSPLPDSLKQFFLRFIISEDYDVRVKDISSLRSEKDSLKDRITEWFAFLDNKEGESISNLLFLCVCILNKDLEGEWNREMITEWIPYQSFLYGTHNVDKAVLPSRSVVRRGLEFKDNSCYQDSVLMCLFVVPNYYITQQILEKDLNLLCSLDSPMISRCVKIPKGASNAQELKGRDCKIKIRIQKELKRIMNYIREGNNGASYTCSNLREIFSLCQITEEFHGTDTQDAGLFIKYLFEIFNVDIAQRKTFTYFYRDVLTSPPTGEEKDVIVRIEKQPNDIPILDVPLYAYPKDITLVISGSSVSQKIVANLFDGGKFPKVDGIEVKTKITIETINTPYLIFTINRIPIFKTNNERLAFDRNQEAMKLKNRVIPEESIGYPFPETTTILNLHGIVVHKNVHYTCFIKIEEIWFYYNDMRNNGELQLVGDYNAMINSSIIDPTIHGTVFFYS